jgi:hypothetical protein
VASQKWRLMLGRSYEIKNQKKIRYCTGIRTKL